MDGNGSRASETSEQAVKYWAEQGYSRGGVIREVDYASQSKGLHPSFAGIKIVDCDTHLTESPDLYTSQAPAALKDKMPRVRRVDGLGEERAEGFRREPEPRGGAPTGTCHNILTQTCCENAAYTSYPRRAVASRTTVTGACPTS